MALASSFAQGHGDAFSESAASIVFIFLFSGLFSISFENTPALVTTVIMPFFLRGLGTGVGWFTSTIFGTLIGQFSPQIFDAIAWKYYAVYIATNCFNAATFYFFYPRQRVLTSNKSVLLLVRKSWAINLVPTNLKKSRTALLLVILGMLLSILRRKS